MSLKKVAPESAPHAVYTDGFFTWKILKTYKNPKGEAKDPYARWLVAATSPMMQPAGSFEQGDTYVSDIVHGGRLVTCTDEWAEAYGVR